MEDQGWLFMLSVQGLVVVSIVCLLLVVILKKQFTRVSRLKELVISIRKDGVIKDEKIASLIASKGTKNGTTDAASANIPKKEPVKHEPIIEENEDMDKKELLEIIQQYRSRVDSLKMFEDQYYEVENKLADANTELDDMRFASEKSAKQGAGQAL